MHTYETWARVLADEPNGRSVTIRGRRGNIIQALGETNLALLELLALDDQRLIAGERQFIGKEKRDKIVAVLGRLRYDQLSRDAQDALQSVCYRVVAEDEPRFVAFFNSAQGVSIRLHALELLPDVGKARLKRILDARASAPFGSYEDIEKRTGYLNVQEKLVARITREITGDERIRLFVAG